VLRAKDYLKTFSDKRLAQHTRDDVTGYLEQVGRLGRISDWQFVQIVDGVQNLLVTAQAPVAEEVDWASGGIRPRYICVISLAFFSLRLCVSARAIFDEHLYLRGIVARPRPGEVFLADALARKWPNVP